VLTEFNSEETSELGDLNEKKLIACIDCVWLKEPFSFCSNWTSEAETCGRLDSSLHYYYRSIAYSTTLDKSIWYSTHPITQAAQEAHILLTQLFFLPCSLKARLMRDIHLSQYAQPVGPQGTRTNDCALPDYSRGFRFDLAVAVALSRKFPSPNNGPDYAFRPLAWGGRNSGM
jgi:hypothetical protein